MKLLVDTHYLTYRQYAILKKTMEFGALLQNCFQSGRKVSRNISCSRTLLREAEKHGQTDLALFPNPGSSNIFVPRSEAPRQEDLDRLQEFVNCSKRLLVLTGAGLSTESGIPDYRSEGVGLYARSSNRPVQYQDFVKYPEIRQRYWARNYVGWPKFGYFLPNSCHEALAQWERVGRLHWLVTQNVDALHHKAGSRQVTELHGSGHRVMCLQCDQRMSRVEMQALIVHHNPDWKAEAGDMAPDADVQLTTQQIQGFKVPPCPKCGGDLKPEITFFGDNVAKETVYSGYRFAAAASDQGKPIAIVNIGPTRADKLAHLKVDSKCGQVLPYVEVS
ncbi:SIR4-like protein [Mya arenaria]|uniref:SIR4-like protein n=1 Tax=Mya arenaria TaxID=6604 RepID=A0ABY7EA53_MYAAR|nr:SIR4-like protein [Mya arenaria]